jgi:hypothetical protein
MARQNSDATPRVGCRVALPNHMIEKGSTAYESTINGACASFGGMGTHMKLKLRIITEENDG